MATKIPEFSYTGKYSTEIKNGYWYIYLKSSGTLKFTYAKTLSACIVGGGAGGLGAGHNRWTSGGKGGTVNNVSGISAAANTGYAITIGSGGPQGDTNGGSYHSGSASSAFGYSASGGSGGADGTYGNSGDPYGGQIGSAGDKGADGTYAFGDTTLRRYGANGGNGGSRKDTYGGNGGDYGGGRGGGGARGGRKPAVAGTANTGSGGGGRGAADDYNWGGSAAAGGSGIVILRGTEDDFLPVKFNGTQLTELIYNGTTVQHLIYNGQQLY